MADKDQGLVLPQRVPGAARAWPASPVPPIAPALPEELRRRMQAAVKAERARVVGSVQDRAAGVRTASLPTRVRPPGSRPGKQAGPEETSSLANRTNGTRQADVAGGPVATPGRIAGRGPAVRPGPSKPRRRARLAALCLAVIVIGSLAAVAVDRAYLSPSAVRAQAAAWVAEQVSPDVTVSCDAAMCAALQADGFPASKLVVLGPASADPVPSLVVVETAAVRELFGTSLAIAWAPAVLASFGSGTNAITVRVVAPHGSAAYQAALNAGLASRKSSGVALLHHSQVTVSAIARSQLLAGQVDPRLLLALASLARHKPIDIVRFGNLGPGASPSLLFRFADLAEAIPAAHMSTAAYAPAAWAVLDAVKAGIRPARAVSAPVQGQAIFRVEFSAPSPLGNFGAGSP
jgi:hypothetical protein